MLFTESICDNKLYLKLYKKGNFVACPFLTAYFLKNNLSQNRIGITTGKKVGNAVKRNRARRIIRAAYRLNEINFPIGYDIVFVAREDIVDKKTGDIEKFFRKRLIEKINNDNKNSKNHNEK